MVAVIGAGAAGLATAAMLQSHGQSVVVLERAGIGAAWTGRYDRLHLHTVRWLSGLPGRRMPRSAGKWPARDSVVEYLRRYAARHRLDVRAGVEVSAITRVDGGWALETSDATWSAERVVVATGHSNVPFLPDWPGSFDGEIVHSAHYRNAARYRGLRTLVVGAGNSGAEIAVDLVEGGAAQVLLSVRTPPSIVRRDTLGIPSQLFGIAAAHLPVRIVDAIAASMRRRTIPDLEPYGLPAPTHPYTEFLRRRALPILDVGIVRAVRTRQVRVVAALDRFADGAPVLADGSREAADAVIAATGFRPGLEPLVGHLGVLGSRGEPLVHGAEEHPGAPGLHFVGYRIVLGGNLRQSGIEGRQLARAVASGARH